jgi:hypothetical protein
LDLEEMGKTRTEMQELESQLRFSVLDQNGDGKLSVADIHVGLRDYLGLSVYEDEMTLAKIIHDYADVTESGYVSVDDFEVFCTGGLPKEFRPLQRGNSINKAFPEPVENPPDSSAGASSTPSLAGMVSHSSQVSDLSGEINTETKDEKAAPVVDTSAAGMVGR